jgi:hypothetical protein
MSQNYVGYGRSMPELHYHSCTCELVERKLQYDAEATQGLRALDATLEDLFGITLPASVREWYALTDAVEILHEFSNQENALTLSEMREELERRRPAEEWDLDLVSERLLPLIWENQGVALWCLRLDGSDDPPVVVYDDDQRVKSWADAFSRFTADWVWADLAWAYDLLLRARAVPLGPTDLARLRAAFQEQAPITSCTSVHIFRRADAVLRIWERTPEHTYWCLRAQTPTALLDTGRVIWSYGTLAHTLELGVERTDGEAYRVLQTLRRDVSSLRDESKSSRELW